MYTPRSVPPDCYNFRQWQGSQGGDGRSNQILVQMWFKSATSCRVRTHNSNATSCDYRDTSLLLLPLHQNPPIYPQNTLKWLPIFCHKTLAKLAKTLSTRSPRQPPFPPVQYQQPRHSREWQQNPPVRSGVWQNTHGGAPNVANFSTLSIYATAE